MLETFIKSLQKESDRGCALIGAELLSDALQEKLEQAMQGGKELKKKLLTGLGPLSTFSAKIKISYCFKVISQKLYIELNHLREVRNIAAHSIEGFSFENDSAQKHLSSMVFFEQVLTDIENGNIHNELVDTQMKNIILACKNNKLFSGRAKYNYTVAILYGMIAKDGNVANKSLQRTRRSAAALKR